MDFGSHMLTGMSVVYYHEPGSATELKTVSFERKVYYTHFHTFTFWFTYVL